MPLFRIMGGPSRSSSGGGAPPPPQTSSSGARTSSSGGGPSVSRYTYPGQRPSATNPPGAYNNIAASVQQQQSTSAVSSSMNPHYNSHMAASSSNSNSQTAPLLSHRPPEVILRGSSVASSTTTGSHSRIHTPGASSLQHQQQQPTGNSSSTVSVGSSNHNTPTTALTTPSTTTLTTTTRPGAYQVTRTTSGPAQVYRVTVPNGVRPGTEFTVHAGPRRVRVRCPPTCQAGQSLQITLPPEPETHYLPLRMATLTATPLELQQMIVSSNSSSTNKTPAASGKSLLTNNTASSGGGAVPMTPEVQRVNQLAALSGGSAQTFLVTIPPNIYPGMTFVVNVNQQRFMVTCPPNAGPNQKVRIVPPNNNSNSNNPAHSNNEPPEAAPTTQVFEVLVPPGVSPGQPFALMANGQRCLVTCPPNVVSGQKIRFQLPVQPSQAAERIQLCYKTDKDNGFGWMRTIRVTDMKFQWVRLDSSTSNSSSASSMSTLPCKSDKNESSCSVSALTNKTESLRVDEDNDDDVMDTDSIATAAAAASAEPLNSVSKFDFSKSAYVRKITFLEGNDARMRTGFLELVPANEAVVDSKLVQQNRTLLSYADIASIQGKSLEEKTDWFQKICTQLTLPWDDGHVKLVVRRKHLLLDSVDAVMSFSREDLRKRWRIEFLGEPGVEAGGLTREWFELVTEQMYDPDFGLWKPSINNQMCMDINPASGISCPDDHLVYFRFLGRVLGRALFDRQLVKGHMTRTIYRHLLGWPVTFEDIESQDEDYYKSLKKVALMSPESIPNMCLDFTVTEEHMGAFTDMELIEGGRDREVNSENLSEYLELNLKHRLMGRTKLQLTELLLGFFDIVPEPALTIFDANELELILCGLPVIEMDDWKSNTLYSGCFSNKALKDQVVAWFWEIVTDDFDTEMKARLLQFVTGTSGVPSRGFSVLQGIDGNIKKFTIHGVDLSTSAYPRAHTCFNRLDLPLFSSKEELREKLKLTITLCGVGFDME